MHESTKKNYGNALVKCGSNNETLQAKGTIQASVLFLMNTSFQRGVRRLSRIFLNRFNGFLWELRLETVETVRALCSALPDTSFQRGVNEKLNSYKLKIFAHTARYFQLSGITNGLNTIIISPSTGR